MHIQETAEYRLIRSIYQDKTANRSGVPLMSHIDQGLQILAWEQADSLTQRAYCLHPVFQSDEALSENYTQVNCEMLDGRAVLLAMEYRNIANQYLSVRKISYPDEIKLSPLPQVHQMLVADKIQNRKDFEAYHQNTHPRAAELAQYFQNWFLRLQISQEKYQHYCSLLFSEPATL